MSDNLDEPENRENSFADEVDAAIENLQLPPADEAELTPEAQQMYDEPPPKTEGRQVLMVGDDPRGVSLLHGAFSEWAARNMGGNSEGFQVVEESHEELKPTPEQLAAWQQAEAEHVAEFSIDFDESPSKTPPVLTTAARSHAGFGMFKAGFTTCLTRLQEFIDEHKDDEDFLAIIFNDFLHDDYTSQHIAETVAWANHVDVSDGALLPKTDKPAGTFAPQVLTPETEKRQLEMGDATPVAEKATRADYSGFDREELELMLSEALAVNEAAQQQQQRDELLPGLWAAITDYFNGVMADEPESQLDQPLVVRIQMYNERLRNEAWQWQNANHMNEPDFYELPPILSDLLINQPEADYNLFPGLKLVNLIVRYKNGFEAAQRAANILNVTPQANGYDEMIDKIKEHINDAVKWHESRNKDV